MVLVYTIVTSFVVSSLIYLIEEALLEKIIGELMLLQISRQSEVINKSARIGITIRLVVLFMVAAPLSNVFELVLALLPNVPMPEVKLAGLSLEAGQPRARPGRSS